MKKAEQAVAGSWRITGTEVWGADYWNMEAQAYITIRDDPTGTFQFGLVPGDLDARVGMTNGVAPLEFSWSGADENSPITGRGYRAMGYRVGADGAAE